MAIANEDPTQSRLRSLSGSVPLVAALRGYRREWIGGDLRGGLSATLVMIPSVIAYAGLANLRPEHGLYAALAGMIGYALFASSRQVIAGPDAAITLLVASAVGPLAAGDPARAAALAAATAVLGGLLMLLAARLRVGAVADFLSKPVLIGYMTGAALILVSTQLGKLFGIPLLHQDFFPLLYELGGKLGQTHALTLGLGVGFLLLMLAAQHWFPRLPGALVVILVALPLSALLDLERRGVRVVGHVPAGLPLPALPAVTLADVQALLSGAIGIALLTFPDGILMARAFALKNRTTIRPTQELRALAVSNLCAGLCRGFSVGASQSRTTVNDAAGGRTQMASLIAVATLGLFLLFLTPLLQPLPTVALGAILVFAGVSLVDVPAYRMLRRLSPAGYAIALLVTVGVLVAGVVPGILIGAMLSLVMLLGRLARPSDAVLQEVEGTGKFHDLGEAEVGVTVPGLVAYRFYAPLFYGNAEYFVERVRGLVDRSPERVRWVVVDAQAITELDVTGADVLGQLIAELQRRGIALKFARANRPLREKLARLGLADELGEGTLFPSVHAAIAAFRKQAGP